jgi:hypothetical protein
MTGTGISGCGVRVILSGITRSKRHCVDIKLHRVSRVGSNVAVSMAIGSTRDGTLCSIVSGCSDLVLRNDRGCRLRKVVRFSIARFSIARFSIARRSCAALKLLEAALDSSAYSSVLVLMDYFG